MIDDPNPIVIEAFLFIIFVVASVQVLWGTTASQLEICWAVFGGLWFSVRLYIAISSVDTHEKRREE